MKLLSNLLYITKILLKASITSGVPHFFMYEANSYSLFPFTLHFDFQIMAICKALMTRLRVLRTYTMKMKLPYYILVSISSL